MQELLIKFGINIVSIFIIIYFLYKRNSSKSEYIFTYVVLNSIIFLLGFLLQKIELKLGFAIGFFAIFGILRYRTITIPIKEMTYLFAIIGLSIINSLMPLSNYLELFMPNLLIIFILLFLELKNNKQKQLKVVYNDLENINFKNEKILIKELEQKLHLDIIKIEIKNINYFSNTVELIIYYSS
jgi:hypothetical protein